MELASTALADFQPPCEEKVSEKLPMLISSWSNDVCHPQQNNQIHHRRVTLTSHISDHRDHQTVLKNNKSLLAASFGSALSLGTTEKGGCSYNYQRKFRSQTSDNMERWKAEMGRVREKSRREKEKVSEIRRKKIQLGKAQNTAVFFRLFVGREGRKVGSLKRRVRSHLARWETRNCTPLWREAHFQVQTYKTHQHWTTFGSWDVEKWHAAVARSPFWSQNVQNTPFLEHFWKSGCRKMARGSGHFSKIRCWKKDR